jgi:hypothetical protein
MATAACGARDAVPTPAAAATRDSAGITIVENTAPLWTPTTAWRIDSTPVFDVGGSDTDSTRQFARILGVHRMSDGSVAVLDAASWSLRFFDASGNPTKRAGRRGHGPGELPFQPRRSLSCGGDTVYVDIGRHLTGYARTGKHVGNVRVAAGAGRFPRAAQCSPSGVLGEVGTSARTEEPHQTGSTELAWYGVDGKVRAVIDTFVTVDLTCALGPEGPELGCGWTPFTRRFAFTTLGRGIATSHDNDRQIDVRDSTGAVQRIVRIAGGARPVTDADIAQYRDFVRRTIKNPGLLRAVEAELSGSKLPTTIPWLGDMRGDAAGNLWVREYDLFDMVEYHDEVRLSPGVWGRSLRPPDRAWTVFDSTGQLLGNVVLPARFDLRDIGRDWIIGVWRDAMDVEHVRIYRLVKP